MFESTSSGGAVQLQNAGNDDQIEADDREEKRIFNIQNQIPSDHIAKLRGAKGDEIESISIRMYQFLSISILFERNCIFLLPPVYFLSCF